jgi:hypothetical protein
MSAPLREGDLIETLRAIVLGVDTSTLPPTILSILQERGWLNIAPMGNTRLTILGQAALAEDGESALREIFEWLESPMAEEFFRM